jgi:hypothetical protein
MRGFRQEHGEELRAYDRRRYQAHRTEKLAYQGNYRKGHKKENREYMREYMRDYREGKRRRVQAEPQPPIQVFPDPEFS